MESRVEVEEKKSRIDLTAALNGESMDADNEMPFILPNHFNLIFMLQMVFVHLISHLFIRFGNGQAQKKTEFSFVHFHEDELACIFHKLIASFQIALSE